MCTRAYYTKFFSNKKIYFALFILMFALSLYQQKGVMI